MANTLIINELFHSIQGESTWAGMRCVFIRLAGCHLRCGYCDTEYAFHEGKKRAIEDILTACERIGRGCDLYEITGGEPLLQPGVHALMKRLCDAGKTVLIETSGACDISACDERVIRIMDLKTPGSGESANNLWQNIEHLKPRDEVKFVLTSREDYEWALAATKQFGLGSRVHAVLLSPAHEMPAGKELSGCAGLGLRDAAEWMLADEWPANTRLQMQLHKLIWEPLARGV